MSVSVSGLVVHPFDHRWRCLTFLWWWHALYGSRVSGSSWPIVVYSVFFVFFVYYSTLIRTSCGPQVIPLKIDTENVNEAILHCLIILLLSFFFTSYFELYNSTLPMAYKLLEKSNKFIYISHKCRYANMTILKDT